MSKKRKEFKPIHLGRHILPSGKFYYEIYENEQGECVSDPVTFKCQSEWELKDMINREPRITMQTQEHFQRLQECQRIANMAS